MEDALLRVGYVLCSPVIWLAKQSQQRRHDIRDGVIRGQPVPKPLKGRKRALTPPNAPNAQSQLQSKLLSLPLEIRRLIWTECLGRHVLHLSIWDSSLRCAVCTAPNPGGLCNPECHSFNKPGWSSNKDKQTLLSVLMTCRQVYFKTSCYRAVLN